MKQYKSLIKTLLLFMTLLMSGVAIASAVYINTDQRCDMAAMTAHHTMTMAAQHEQHCHDMGNQQAPCCADDCQCSVVCHSAASLLILTAVVQPLSVAETEAFLDFSDTLPSNLNTFLYRPPILA